MRVVAGVFIAFLLGSGAVAQPYTMQDLTRFATRQCLSQHHGQPNAKPFCTCYVNRWTGLWNPTDWVEWSQSGATTQHMQAMESQAAADCARYR